MICKQCSKKISIIKRKYCSEKCKQKYWNSRRPKQNIPKQKLKCLYCEKIFYARAKTKYCSQICNVQYWKYEQTKNKLYNKECKGCKEMFVAKTKRQIFCSEKCSKRYKNARKIYNLTTQEYDKITRKCEICGFTECVDCHHKIPKSKGGKNVKENYIGLCPNHHKMLHMNKYYLKEENKKWKIKKSK